MSDTRRVKCHTGPRNSDGTWVAGVERGPYAPFPFPVGYTQGELTIVEWRRSTSGYNPYVECSCGNRQMVHRSNFVSGRSTRCNFCAKKASGATAKKYRGYAAIVPDDYQSSDILLLGNIDPALQIKVMEQLQSRPKLIVMDTMNFWMDIAWDNLIKAIGMVDVLTINDAEARQLSKEHSLVKAAKKILKMGPKFLIIKKGEHGALLFHDNNVFFAPALPLEDVFDPTGAGDTFAGGFCGFLDKTRDISFDNMKRAIIYGSAMASFCVEKFGTERLKELSHKDIEQRVQDFIDLVQFDIEIED